MANFIELVERRSGRKVCVNVRYIEQVIADDYGCAVYFAFNCPDAVEQDFISTKMSYDEVVALIAKGGEA